MRTGRNSANCQYTTGPHFAPRFGFAYQPFNNPNTVIRGGFGVFYDQLTGNDTNPKNIGGNPPVYQTSTANSVVGYGSITPAGFGPSGVGHAQPARPLPASGGIQPGVPA